MPAPADDLDGTYDLAAAGLFGLMGFDDFAGLAAGDFLRDLVVSFDSTGLGIGIYTGSALLSPVGFNASGFREPLDMITLAFRAQIVDQAAVPAPGVLQLLALSLLVLAGAQHRRGRRVARMTA